MMGELEASGFAILTGAVSEPNLVYLLNVVANAPAPVTNPSGVPFAVRDLLGKLPTLPAALESTGMTSLASTVLGQTALPIDATFFDKNSDANWTVPGHQDRVLPVADDFTGDSRIRHGIRYAEPHERVLASLLALRIHFDPTDAETGALCFVPGSHREGILPNDRLAQISLEQFIPCPAQRGDLLLMRPLTLHRSSPSSSNQPRRVLHFVYAPADTVTSLKWRRSA
jgi:ectoine hydroxylase-related dioxygenase (phytanoyl-CoA dioxygenase family)